MAELLYAALNSDNKSARGQGAEVDSGNAAGTDTRLFDVLRDEGAGDMPGTLSSEK